MSNEAIKREVREVGRNSAVYIVGQALSRGVAFLMIPIYTRCISPTDYGAGDLIDIICGMSLMVVAMGLGEALTRYYYAEEDQHRDLVVSTVILGCASLGTLSVGGFLFATYFLSWTILALPYHQVCLGVGIAAVWFSVLSGIVSVYLRIRYMSRTFVALSLTQLLLSLLLNFYLVVIRQWSILGIYVSTLITLSVTGLPVALLILKHVGFRMSPRLLLRALRFGLPLVPAKIAGALSAICNRLSLTWLSSGDPVIALANVGIFSIADKFASVVGQLLVMPFRSYWDPRRFQLLFAGDRDANATIARVCTYATYCTVFASLLLCVSIESVITIMVDSRYHAAYAVVPWLSLAGVFAALEFDLGTGIMYQGRTAWMTAVSFVSFASVLLWNYLLVPRFGVMAAATAILTANVIRCVLVYTVSQRTYRIPFELRRLGLLLVTACALYVGSRWLEVASPYLTLLVRVGVAAVFPAALLAVGFYRADELRLLGRLVEDRYSSFRNTRSWQ